MVIASIRMDKKRLLKSSYSNKVSQVTVCLISSNAFCSKSANLSFTLFGVSVVKGCSNWIQYHQGGRHLLRGCLPSPSTSSKYYQQHMSGGARPKAPGRPVGQSQGRPTRYWLEPFIIQAASEGSMSLIVAGSLDTKCRRRSGEGRVEHDRIGKGGGGGSITFARG